LFLQPPAWCPTWNRLTYDFGFKTKTLNSSIPTGG
jgi:hypothetical protein